MNKIVQVIAAEDNNKGMYIIEDNLGFQCILVKAENYKEYYSLVDLVKTEEQFKRL